MTREYAVVYEKTATGWGAHAPDLAGPGVTGATFEETEILLRNGIDFHLEGMPENGLVIAESKVRVATLSVAA